MTKAFLPPPAARIAAGVISAIAVASLLLQAGVTMSTGVSFGEMISILLRYFTVLTNLLVAVTMGRIAFKNPASPRWLLALTTAIAGVGLVHHALLAGLHPLQGWGLVADHGLHTIVPLLTVAWFLGVAPARRLQWRDVAWVVVWPVLYCAYALLRGSLDDNYPYPFIDANELGTGALAINIAGLMVFFVLFGALMLGLLRILRGRKAH